MFPRSLQRQLPLCLTENTDSLGEKSEIRQIHLVIWALVLLVLMLGYVWSQVSMTKLEYRLAVQYELQRKLTEDQRRLNAELAALKAPQRIEYLAKEKLGLTYPEMDRIIFIK
jgi:cell division protein FtsL